MRLYHPLTKPDGRVQRSKNQNTNPYFGKRGAEWVKDSNASLYSAQREHTNRDWRQVQHRVNRTTLNVIWTIVAILVMIVIGFVIYAIALGL